MKFYILLCLMGHVLAQQSAVTIEKGVVTLWFNTSAQYVAYSFDYCNIVACPPGNWHTSIFRGNTYVCVTRPGNDYCASWNDVGWNTGRDWGYRPKEGLDKVDKNGKSLISRMTLIKQNPNYPCKQGACLPHTLTIDNPSANDVGMYVLGVYIPGGTTGRLGKFWIKDIKDKPTVASSPSIPLSQVTNTLRALSTLSFEDKLAVETGYSDSNLWVEWMRYNAMISKATDCVVCATARPHLGSVPFPIPPEQSNFTCIVSLFKNMTVNETCQSWQRTYPPLLSPQLGPGITVYKGPYHCIELNDTGSGGRNVSHFPLGWCNTTTYPYDNSPYVNQSRGLSDLAWLCGDNKIRPYMKFVWVGQCALVKAIMPLQILKKPPSLEDLKDYYIGRGKSTRTTRELKGSFDPHVYIDAMGVPRGVPDEFKARNQVAAGFESLIPIITVNKNVDWINYIYYNQQRFVNYTRDALKGVVEQLGPTSIMAFQNRMALDMILAEKGGVCKMIGASCCTFIPNNTAPDGSITKALEHLTNLSEELKHNSGIKSWSDWFMDWTGGWNKLFQQVGMVLAGVFVLLLFLLCCGIPLYRSLVNRIDSATGGAGRGIFYEQTEKVSLLGAEEKDIPMADPPTKMMVFGELV